MKNLSYNIRPFIDELVSIALYLKSDDDLLCQKSEVILSNWVQCLLCLPVAWVVAELKTHGTK